MSHADFASVHRLQQHPGNIRADLGDLTGLADSIRVHGILQALVVEPDSRRPGRFTVLAGHRRLEAAKLAGLDEVPVTVVRPAGNAAATVVMLVENCQRADLGPVEKAEAMGRLRDRGGMTAAQIARATGFTPGTVSYYLSLLDLDEASRERVRASQVTAAEAVAAVRQVRKAARRGEGKPARKASVAARHFSRSHPLAPLARKACRQAGHLEHKIGGVACGFCWESAIRADALATAGEAA